MYVQFWFNNQGFITVFNQVLQTIDGDKSCHQSRVRFSFCKTDINLIDLGNIQPFDPKYALRSLRILNWAQLEMRTSSISKLMKSKGQPKMGIHIVFRKYMYFRQPDQGWTLLNAKYFFLGQRPEMHFIQTAALLRIQAQTLELRVGFKLSELLSLQNSRITQVAKQKKSQELKKNSLNSTSPWKLDSTNPLAKKEFCTLMGNH